MSWQLERSAESIAQGIGCSEENDSERVPVARSIQPTVALEHLAPLSRYPRFACEATQGAVVAAHSIIQLYAVSECRIRNASVAIAAGEPVSYRFATGDQRTANQATATKVDAFADLPSRTLVETGTNAALPGTGPRYAHSVEPVIALPLDGLVVPQSFRIIVWALNQNVAFSLGVDCEERDGRVFRTLSA